MNHEMTKLPNGAGPTSNFIRAIVAEDNHSGRYGGRVQTRFPPEPNGYLHIGHAKSICLNFGIAAENNGLCNLRFDDTNPEKESQEYVDAIKESIQWLGFDWAGDVHYSSSYFQVLFELAEFLIEAGFAYVCDLNSDEAREYRGSLTTKGIDSPYRTRDVAENLRLFHRMKLGEFPNGACSLRAKIDMSSPNINMRDPVLYRIRHVLHHQTGNKWCIYPTYDYTHCVSDALESVTHSLCTLEFEDHRPLYEWFLDALGNENFIPRTQHSGTDSIYNFPKQIEFAKLKLNYTVVGKRKLKRLVDEGLVSGWDDPRMPTLAGMRRLGYTPSALRNFCESVGVSKNEGVVDIAMLEHAIREDLDASSPRVMCVLDPLRMVITNLGNDDTATLSLARHPKITEFGMRNVPFSNEILIDRADFLEEAIPGFKRLVLGGEVRLRGSYVVRCDEIETDLEGRIQKLKCSADLATLGKKPEGRKVKGVIHWVSADKGVPVEVRLYDRLFNVEYPESKDVEDFTKCLNPNSLRVIKGCIIEPSIFTDSIIGAVQFEREGYFTEDISESSSSRRIFNRTITLRNSWE